MNHEKIDENFYEIANFCYRAATKSISLYLKNELVENESTADFIGVSYTLSLIFKN